MAMEADAKTFSLFSAQSPVGLGGYFAAPAINPVSPELIARTGAGVAAGLVLSPLAAVIAFIDPGDADAAACGPVLQGARATAQRTKKGEARKDVGKGTPAVDCSSTDQVQPLVDKGGIARRDPTPVALAAYVRSRPVGPPAPDTFAHQA